MNKNTHCYLKRKEEQKIAKGKYAGKKALNVKPFAMLLAIGVLMGTAIGGTLAWLTDDTDPVTNTFAVGDINIKLEETWNADSDDADKENDHWEGKLIPGTDLSKDPKVTVLKDSEACWLFVKVTETNWPAMKESDGQTRKVKYEIADGWNLVDGETDIYFRKVDATTDDTPFYVLKNNKVSVSNG